MSKGAKSENSLVEKGEFVCSDVRGFSQPYPNLCKFSLFIYFETCTTILESQPSEVPQNVKNHEILESLQKVKI